MVAVVVPVGVVLLAAAVAAAVLTRRRRAARRAAAYGKGSSHQTDSTSSVPAKPGETPSSATRSSDIFMGLEAGTAPVWTEKHEQEVRGRVAPSKPWSGLCQCSSNLLAGGFVVIRILRFTMNSTCVGCCACRLPPAFPLPSTMTSMNWTKTSSLGPQ